MAEDAARAERHAAEAKAYDEALGKLLDGMNADTPLAEFFQHTRRSSESSRDQVVAAAVSDSILLEAGDISSEDQKDSAAMGAVTVAESMPEHKAALRPALLRLREVTGREELVRWLR